MELAKKQIALIDYIRENPMQFVGFSLDGGMSRMMAYKFGMGRQEVTDTFYQMIADEQLAEAGLFGNQQLYSAAKMVN